MNRSAGWYDQGIFYLAASFYFVAVFLRSILAYQDSPEIGQVLVLLLIWLVLAASETFLSTRWSSYFPIYLVFQTILVLALLTTADSPDFFAALFNILSMQVMLRLNPKIGALWIGMCALAMELLLAPVYGSQAIALTLIYTAGNIFFGSYALATRRAQAARDQNLAFIKQLQEANRQMRDYSLKLEQLAVARERNRMARELHDSVTQTVFSMTLTTQSARMLLDHDSDRVGAQLERLSQLAKSALSEMQLLISELHPVKVSGGGLVSALRQHLTTSRFPETLSVSLHIEGDETLDSVEEQNLFRILQESLNNIVKHAQATQAHIELHLTEPFWIEVEDQGQGFDLQQASASGGVGLKAMCERAAEIGWDLQVVTSTGAGTRIRVEKLIAGGRLT
jgi:signal transduction histidine kinase